MAFVARKRRNSRGIALKAHTNVGYWGSGPSPVDEFHVVTSVDRRTATVKVKMDKVAPASLTLPVWFYTDPKGRSVLLSDDEVRTITYRSKDIEALIKNQNTVYISATQNLPPMPPEIFAETLRTREANKKANKEKRKQAAKRKRPSKSAQSDPPTSTAKKQKTLDGVAEPVPPPPPPGEVVTESWTGAAGMTSISHAMEDGMVDELDRILTETGWNSPELLGRFYTQFWMRTLRRMSKLDTHDIPDVIETDRRRVALSCLQTGFMTVLYIYKKLARKSETLSFVEHAAREWQLDHDLPFVQFVLRGTGMRDAASGQVALTQAQFPAGTEFPRPEYGSATFLGMWIAWVFYVTW